MTDLSGNDILNLDNTQAYMCCNDEMKCDCPNSNTFKCNLFTDEQLLRVVEYIVDINYRKKKENLRTLLNERALLLEVIEEATNKDIYEAIMILNQQNPNNTMLKKTFNLFF